MSEDEGEQGRSKEKSRKMPTAIKISRKADTREPDRGPCGWFDSLEFLGYEVTIKG